MSVNQATLDLDYWLGNTLMMWYRDINGGCHEH